jgi:hypothetical protein
LIAFKLAYKLQMSPGHNIGSISNQDSYRTNSKTVEQKNWEVDIPSLATSTMTFFLL